MKAIIPVFNENSQRPLYLQLYDYIKQNILTGEIPVGQRLPSLRSLAKSLEVSLTTCSLAYNQLSVEGYIYSKPQSGHYVSDIYPDAGLVNGAGTEKKGGTAPKSGAVPKTPEYPDYAGSPFDKISEPGFIYDLSCFDFNKWKKCFNKALTDYSHLLLFESDPQGEEVLRQEISRYVYLSRGVLCDPSQIVIGAGTQQITSHIATILQKMQINHVAVEEPGYLPVTNIFRDRGFAITPVGVNPDGIDISKLPANIRTAVYTAPSNQFPTGAVMPAGNRYRLLGWAKKNDSFIIEDDYDSELRYFGKPIPALQGLDTDSRVVYLGSFSSTLFASIKISYMVLPRAMSEVFADIKDNYSQTCSKTEQLTLALFMEQGFYQTSIKKLRNLCAQKLQAVIAAIDRFGRDFITLTNTSSGINVIMRVKSRKSADLLCAQAAEMGVLTVPAAVYTDEGSEAASSLIFYYNQIPLDIIDATVGSLIKKWK